MLYKQKLRVEQAFQYKEGVEGSDFESLVKWYRKYSLHKNTPCYWIGRVLYIYDIATLSGDYVILSVDRKKITRVEQKEFESLHSKYTEKGKEDHGKVPKV